MILSDIREADPVTSGEIPLPEEDQQPGLPPIETAAALVGDESITMPPQVIEGLLHQGLKGVLGSASKARKTWILLDLALSVSTGTPWWRFPTKRGRVLFINFEIPRPFIRDRIRVLAERKGITDLSNLDVWTLRGHSAPLWRLLPDMTARMDGRGYSLVEIDPIYKGLGNRDENSAGDIGQLCNEIEEIAVSTKASTLIAAHFSKGNKSGTEAIDRIAGSGVYGRDADTMVLLTAHEEPDAYAVDFILRNLPEQPSFTVEWQYPVMVERGDLDPANLKTAAGRKRTPDAKLLRHIEDTTSQAPISISEWAKLAGMDRATLSDRAGQMREAGLIATVGDGTNSRKFITQKGRAIIDGRL